MNIEEGRKQFNRLLQAGYRLPPEQDKQAVFKEWFPRVAHYHVDAVETGISELITGKADTFWPAPGDLISKIRARIDRHERARADCETCGGTTWIDVAPYKAHGIIYDNAVMRCPDCGVPAPHVLAHSDHQALSVQECADWRAQREGWASDEAKRRVEAALEPLRAKIGKDAA